ncbi:MAG: TonB-dependent receptor [Gammaproteobacteria bacterium]|nr:TonB-dependent receptor [Gammaproteobacteria bacterium]MDE2250713.1 TonB-dependent receptor [Gammaproteobacteria bacterium]
MNTHYLVARRGQFHNAAVVGLFLALGCNASAGAQTPPPAAARQGSGDLEEIVVTATRRSEALSKVPISVTAVNQEALDAHGMKDFQDIARFTPGVTIDNSITNAISIRGISSSGGAGTTGIYLDDTPIQMRSVGFNPDDTLPKTFDLDRVEVLRGPQGTLFGAGSEGGTVRYILTAPKLHGSSTYVRSELSTTTGGQPSYELGVAHGAALIDGTLGIRMSAWYRNDGGWIDRVDPTTRTVTERSANRADAYMGRLAAVWQPVSNFTVTPSIVYQKSNRHDESTFWPAYSNPGAGQFYNASPERLPVPDSYYLPAIKLEWNLAHSQLISNTSYYSRNEETAYLGTVYDLNYYQALGWPTNPINDPNYVGNSPAISGCGPSSVATVPPCDWYPLVDGNGLHLPAGFTNYQSPNKMTNQQRSWAQEVRLQSTDDGARWRWTVGAFWQQAKELSIENLEDKQIYEFFQYLYGVNPESVFFGDFYHCPGHPGTGVNAAAIVPACSIYYNSNRTTDRQFAGFGELSYALTDKLRVTLGERVARLSFSLDHYADGFENYGPSAKTAASSETASTPKLGLSFQADANNLYYATYAKGFRAGGGNAPLPSYCNADLDNTGYPNGAPLTYKSDSTQSFEVGSKNAFGRNFRIATSVYYIRWNDIQQNVYVAGACGLQFTDNLGTAVAKGFDLQAEFAAGPMKFELATGYTEARYTKDSALRAAFCPSASTNPCLPLARAGDAISGQASINLNPGTSAPWTASLGAEYDFKAGARPAYLRFDYQLQTRNNWLANLQDTGTSQYNPDSYPIPANDFAQLRGGVTVGSWNLAAFIDNLFNSHKVTNYMKGQADSYNPAGPPPEQENQYTFRPRTYGLTATMHL